MPSSNDSAPSRAKDTFDQLRNIAQTMFRAGDTDLTNIAAKRQKLQTLQKQQEEMEAMLIKSRQELARIDATWVTMKTSTIAEVVKRTAVETELLGRLEKRRELHSKSVQKGECPLRLHAACVFPPVDEYGAGYTDLTQLQLEVENTALSSSIDEQRGIITAIECDTTGGINVKSLEKLREFISQENTQSPPDVFYRDVSLLSEDSSNTNSPSPADEVAPSSGRLKINELEVQVVALDRVTADEYNPDVLRRRIHVIRTDLLGVARRQHRIHAALDSIGHEMYERRQSIESLQRLREGKESSRTAVHENIDLLRSNIWTSIPILKAADARAAEMDERIRALRTQNDEVVKENDGKSSVLAEKIEIVAALSENYLSKVSAVEVVKVKKQEALEEKQKLSARCQSAKESIDCKSRMTAECRDAIDANKSLHEKAQAAFDGFWSCIGAGPHQIIESAVLSQLIGYFAVLSEVPNDLITKGSSLASVPQYPTLSTILRTQDSDQEEDAGDTQSTAQAFLDFLTAFAGGDLTRNPPLLRSSMEDSADTDHINALYKVYEEACQRLKQDVLSIESRINVSMNNRQRTECQCQQLSQ
ncbi:hypothetical protein XU18_0422 [Perkinsela sp. CCAP 1560/4]|nr:hypothetical protein XU18_0422 [Perkinsela sp. CCAP 1560/4]|eukprot:KNH09737.1 hypothetical protein XU18_0422 [Perkinsela sp. CCAP 1560/4]